MIFRFAIMRFNIRTPGRERDSGDKGRATSSTITASGYDDPVVG
ncbi:MAG: hypothetical protein ACRC5A_10785 [Enterobacteriaceae bacterium]